MYGKKITFPHDREAISDGSGCRQLPQMPVNVHVCSYMTWHAHMSPYMPLKSLQRVVLAITTNMGVQGNIGTFWE